MMPYFPTPLGTLAIRSERIVRVDDAGYPTPQVQCRAIATPA